MLVRSSQGPLQETYPCIAPLPLLFHPVALALALCAGACTGLSPTDARPANAAAPATAEHAILAGIALTLDADGQHVTFATQNGSTVSLAKSDLVGKTVYWATTKGGDPVSNAQPIDQGMSTLSSDLTSTFTTPAHYADGPWEVACVISVTGTPPPSIPAAGDLAAFDNSPPPAGDPPDTGDSVRVHVDGADASLTLTNGKFIRFGTR